MSVADRLLSGETVEVTDLRTSAFRALFGDRLGATLVLASLVWVGLTWRLGFFSNDQYTFANTLLAVADGQLHITQPVYGPASGATPGTYLADGRVYGRNYGVVLVSTVWYVILQALSILLDVRVLLTGLWSLALVAVSSDIGRRLDRQRAGLLTGTAVAGAVFALSALVAEPLPSSLLPLLALQLTTALATAVTTVVCYRLLTRLYNRRLGTAAAVATVAATPVGFWASLPKRHAVTAMFVVCAMYTLYRSRDAAAGRAATRFRALTYVWPALLAWVHAPLGFILLVAIGVVDPLTARSNSPRAMMTVAGAFALALVPFLLTNAVISGNPLMPPRLLDSYGGGVVGADSGSTSTSTTGGGSAAGGDSAATNGGGTGGDGGTFFIALPTSVTRIIQQFTQSYAVLSEPTQLFRVFVHTGYISSVRATQDAAINLSVLASMPLLGGLFAYPVLAVRRLTTDSNWCYSPRQWSPGRVVDAFSLFYVVLLIGLYLTFLPNSHMLTVRYLHPLYPIGVYWLVRLPAVRRAVDTDTRTLALSYGGTVIAGLLTYLSAIAVWQLVLDESVQLYALAALAAASVLGVWTLAATRERQTRAGAVALGVAAGLMSVYLLVAGLSLFPTSGEFLLPAARAVSERIHYARLLGSSPPF